MTRIVSKKSLVAAKVPLATDLVSGELAVNVPDGKLFLKKTVTGTDTIIEIGAVKSVAGRAGDVVLVKADAGLGSVDNTADTAKPVSTAQQAALDLKAPLASPALTGTPSAPTAVAGTNTTQISTTQFVSSAISVAVANLINSAPGALDTLNELATALGDDPNFATTMTNALALKAPLASPTLTGIPAAPTAVAGTATTQLATTAFVDAARVILAAADALKAPLASPALTGVPAAPTATPGTNTTQLATTAFVAALGALKAATGANADITSLTGLTTALSVAQGGTGKTTAMIKGDVGLANVDNTSDVSKPVSTAQQAAIDLKANLASPLLTGTPSAPTATAGTNTTQLATTAFVEAARVILAAADALKAPLASPALTGTPTAPTAAAGTSTTQLSTTAFVDAARALLQASIDLKATIASPTFTGTPLVPTATAGTNTTQAASTAFVAAAITAIPASPVSSVAGRAGVVTLAASDISYSGRTVDACLADAPSVKSYGATGNGTTDDTTAIQAAITAGDTYFPPGNYLISAPILVPSNRRISGSGFNSKITISASATSMSTAWAGSLWFAFCNSNIQASGANSHIEITGIQIDGSLNTHNPFLLHFRNCQYVTVDRCTLVGGGDGTAFTMSSNWKVSNCFAYGQGNACYDSWEGSSEGLYENNIGYVTLGYGMLCTGDTSLNTPDTSGNVSFIGNTIIGPNNSNGGVGIWLQSGSNLTSMCYSCRVVGNYVRGFLVGIRATGGGSHVIDGNTVLTCPTAGIVLSAEVVGNGSQGNVISNNVITGCGNASNTPFVIQSGANNNVISGNSIAGTLSPYAVILDSTTSGNVFNNNFLTTGTTGFLNDAGTANLCSNSATGLYGQGTFTPTLVSSGGGTPTYAAQYGNYQQVGNRIHFNLRVSISALSSLAAGNLTIAGLPKQSKGDSTNDISPVAFAGGNLNSAITVPPIARVLSSALVVTLYKWAAGSFSTLTLADITATAEINIAGSYVANT